VTDISATGSSGGTAVLSDARITYTPPAGFTGTDTLTYTVTDARVASAQGTITVRVLAPEDKGPSFLKVTSATNTVTLRLLGARARSIDSTPRPTWLTGSKSVRARPARNGLFEFTDADKSLYPYRYYRAAR